jgi:uncharacterized SAM-binding protein YcdF (DUF218 family)
MRTSVVYGFMGGAALLVGSSCCLLAVSGDSAIWATPTLLGARVWNAVSGIVWLACALHFLRPLPKKLSVVAALFMLVFAVAALRDTYTYYELIARDAITTTSYIPASLGLSALACGSLVALLKQRRAASHRLNWLWSLPAGAAGGLAACLIVLTTFGATDYRRSADCAIVLGAAVYADGTPSHALQDRVHQAVELYHQGHAPFLVMTGGVDPNHGQSEAQSMAHLAERAGVPRDRILLDEYGKNTRASAVNCAQIMTERGWRSALLVSHDYHLLRAKTAFARAGSRVYTVPAAESHALARAPYFVLRECVAWIYYALPTDLSSSS